jgi:flagellar biosynthesis regulator FlaF
MTSSVEDKGKALKVLDECAEIQKKKSHDYQNPSSRIRQADHYPRGINTIIDMIHQKLTRAYSLLESAEAGVSPNNESIEDTFLDLINYASFAVVYLRGEMDGQRPNHDMFNRKVK